MLSYEEFKEELIKQTKENLPQRYRDAEVGIPDGYAESRP